MEKKEFEYVGFTANGFIALFLNLALMALSIFCFFLCRLIHDSIPHPAKIVKEMIKSSVTERKKLHENCVKGENLRKAVYFFQKKVYNIRNKSTKEGVRCGGWIN